MAEDVIASGKPLVRFEGVSKRFGKHAAVEDFSLDIGRNEFFALLGPVRLRQDHAAAHAGRLRDARRRAHPARRRGHRRAAAASAPRQHDVPELRAVSASHGRGQCRVRAQAGEVAAQGDAYARQRHAVHGEDGGILHPQAASIVGRAAPARGARARVGQAAEGVPARRAAGRARQEAAHADPIRIARLAEEARHHLHHRHARPGRGDDHGRPHRGDE